MLKALIKLIGLDWKSVIKINKYSDFFISKCQKLEKKHVKNSTKMTHNHYYLTIFDII